jgi:hypothetical protein
MPPDLYDLYARFGIASEAAQVLEVEAGNLALAYLALVVDPSKVTPAQTEVFQAVINDLNRKTLGTMFRHLKDFSKIDSAITDILDKALERRNYLTHNFFRTHNFAIQSEQGRAAMAEELDQILSDLQKGHDMLNAMTNSTLAVGGHETDMRGVVDKFVQRGTRIDI